MLDGWIEAVKRYAKVWGVEDASYYYNERANTSLLAAGAWNAGWIAIEEYRSKKYRNTGKSTGRVDLHVSSGEEDVVIESKHVWMNSRFDDKYHGKRVKHYLSLATRDARCTRGAELRFGAAFYIPKFRVDDFDNYDAAKLISGEISRYLKISRADAWAWCFPKESRLTLVESENSYYPGVILGLEAT